MTTQTFTTNYKPSTDINPAKITVIVNGVSTVYPFNFAAGEPHLHAVLTHFGQGLSTLVGVAEDYTTGRALWHFKNGMKITRVSETARGYKWELERIQESSSAN